METLGREYGYQDSVAWHRGNVACLLNKCMRCEVSEEKDKAQGFECEHWWCSRIKDNKKPEEGALNLYTGILYWIEAGYSEGYYAICSPYNYVV